MSTHGRLAGPATSDKEDDHFDWTMFNELNENLIEDNQIKKLLPALKQRMKH